MSSTMMLSRLAPLLAAELAIRGDALIQLQVVENGLCHQGIVDLVVERDPNVDGLLTLIAAGPPRWIEGCTA